MKRYSILQQAVRKGIVSERTILRITVAVSAVIIGILMAVFLGRVDLTVQGTGVAIPSCQTGPSAGTTTDTVFAPVQILVTLSPGSIAKVKPGQQAHIFLNPDGSKPVRCEGTVAALTSRIVEGKHLPIVCIKPGANWAQASGLLSSPVPPGLPWQMPVKAKIVLEENKPIYRLLWETAFRRRIRQ